MLYKLCMEDSLFPSMREGAGALCGLVMVGGLALTMQRWRVLYVGCVWRTCFGTSVKFDRVCMTGGVTLG